MAGHFSHYVGLEDNDGFICAVCTCGWRGDRYDSTIASLVACARYAADCHVNGIDTADIFKHCGLCGVDHGDQECPKLSELLGGAAKSDIMTATRDIARGS